MTDFIKDGDPLGLKLLQDVFESLPPKNLSQEFVSKKTVKCVNWWGSIYIHV